MSRFFYTRPIICLYQALFPIFSVVNYEAFFCIIHKCMLFFDIWEICQYQARRATLDLKQAILWPTLGMMVILKAEIDVVIDQVAVNHLLQGSVLHLVWRTCFIHSILCDCFNPQILCNGDDCILNATA